jgi:UDP:flavonoid glycosyltransferase YjiC (YdhE family)
MIVAFTLPAMAHVKPMMPLLSGLVARQQNVVCYGHMKFEHIIRSSGAAFAPYPGIDYDIDAPDFNLIKMGADLISASQTITSKLLPEIAALSPRLILQDFMAPWASRIGTTLGVPRIHTFATLVFNPATERLMRREDGFVKLARDVFFGSPALVRAMIGSRFALSLREAFGLERSWRRLAPPVCEIVFSLEELQSGDPQGDVPRHYIGHPFQEDREHERMPMQDYALITFGTLSNTDTARFEAAMRGAFQAGLSAVAVCGGKVDMPHLVRTAQALETAHPQREALVVERVPEMEPWIKGAEAVIHHAGMATAWESIRHCKPALFIPANADQMVFADQLERNGLGVRLPRGRERDADAIAHALTGARKLDYPCERFRQRRAQAGGAAAGVGIILAALDAAKSGEARA